MAVNEAKNTALAELRRAFVGMLPQEADILFVIQESGLDRGRINFSGRADLVWYSILNEADLRNRVGNVTHTVLAIAGTKPDTILNAYRAYLTATKQADTADILAESPIPEPLSTENESKKNTMKYSAFDKVAREVEDLIGQDELGQAFDRMDQQLAAYLRANQPERYDEFILHKRTYVNLVNEERQGLLTREESQVRRAQLTNRLLQFLRIVSIPANVRLTPEPTELIVAEAAIAPNAAAFQQLMGVNNLKNIAWMEKALRAADAVCRILTPNGGYGTGFLIAPSLLLTNNHVIPDAKVAAQCYAEFNYQEDAKGKAQQAIRYALDPTRFQTSPEKQLDYTIVGVAEEAGKPLLERWGTLTLNPDAIPVAREYVSIIQHPNGGLKQIVLRGSQVARSWEHRLQYTADTMKGSSGAPVFNDLWQVVALHHAGGELPVNDLGDKREINEGILMAFIAKDAGTLWPAEA